MSLGSYHVSRINFLFIIEFSLRIDLDLYSLASCYVDWKQIMSDFFEYTNGNPFYEGFKFLCFMFLIFFVIGITIALPFLGMIMLTVKYSNWYFLLMIPYLYLLIVTMFYFQKKVYK